MLFRLLAVVSLLSPASAFRVPAARSPSRSAARASSPTLQFGKKKSRYADDGTREQGLDLMSGVDSGLSKGLFSNFKFGTEVEVVPKDKKGKKKGGPRGPRGMARDNSDRGLGGNNSYRNTESARLSDNSGDPGQAIRKARLEAYINSDYAPADKTFGKIIAGSLILVILGLLGGVVAYYGIDGLVFAGSGGKYDSLNLTL